MRIAEPWTNLETPAKGSMVHLGKGVHFQEVVAQRVLLPNSLAVLQFLRIVYFFDLFCPGILTLTTFVKYN